MGKALEKKLAKKGPTQAEYIRGLVEASLGKRGFEDAWRKLALNCEIRERQEFLHRALYAVDRIATEPLLLPPKRPLDEHVRAVLASGTIAEIRADLLTIIQHVTERKDWGTLSPPSSADYKTGDPSGWSHTRVTIERRLRL